MEGGATGRLVGSEIHGFHTLAGRRCYIFVLLFFYFIYYLMCLFVYGEWLLCEKCWLFIYFDWLYENRLWILWFMFMSVYYNMLDKDDVYDVYPAKWIQFSVRFNISLALRTCHKMCAIGMKNKRLKFGDLVLCTTVLGQWFHSIDGLGTDKDDVYDV